MVAILAKLRFLFNNIKCASNFGAELLKLNLQRDPLWIDHNVQRTCESSDVLSDRGSHSTFNTIADHSFSHRSTDRDPDSWFSARP